MTLFVPALRLLMLALNMYDTYKVLKPPKASTRSRDGRPTERALSQRKRKMKGALAVWIVWCCYMIYESTVESIVSLFVPFYDSCKSLVLLFLIFTRARGAEPIFLHVIRPLLRPYAATLDAVADVGRIFGDAAFLVVAYPFNIVSEWWNTYWTPVEAEEEHEISHPISLQPGGGRHRPATTTPSSPSVVGAVASSLYQIWHPPRAAYEEDDDNPPPMPVPQTPESPATLKVRREMEEWRQYPPIPSAYPPTPLPLRFGAPSSPEPVPVISDEARKQMDEWRKYPPFPSAYPATPMTRPTSLNGVVASASSAPQFAAIVEEEEEEEMMPSGFGQSLPSPPELPGPGSVRGASDMRWNALGIYEAKVEDEDDAMDEDDRDDSEQEDDDSDDDFNVTLRTPKPLRTPMTRSRSKREEAVPLSRLSSVSSTTTTSPTAGRKRSRDLVSPAGSEGSTSAEETQPATVALVELTPSESDVDSSRSSGAEEEEEEEDSVSEAEPVAVLVPTRKGSNGNGNSKRRKVVGDETPRRVQPKRGSRDTTPAPVAPAPRRTKSATSTTTAAPNRASSRIAASASAPPPAVASRVSRRGSNK
ncbi:hypothetical protein HMN09_01146500 [Mycena chlorophos]|uniref:Protein YOP1 n=1 Tax=Mycena chlorophos TaxID=658473 RepID=A0A8H6VW74_MYCCL|nr:hypothetical protein HMN09_01146500 [Mycena chlorophos]